MFVFGLSKLKFIKIKQTFKIKLPSRNEICLFIKQNMLLNEKRAQILYIRID